MSAALPRLERGLRQVIDGHDGFLVDLWGTLHDGHELLPGAGDCMRALRRHGPVCLLSNSHRTLHTEITRLGGMGVTPNDYDGLVTAGEVCRRRLRADLPAGTGPCFFFFGLEENASLLDGLGFERVAEIGDADFVFVGDPEPDRQDDALYDPLLLAALDRGLILVCPNPDRWSFWGNERRVKPGAIAERYETMGGRALWYGKPCANTFEAGLETFALHPRKVLVIGDGLSNDMAGARDAGFDACFVAGGREASGLGIAPGELPDPATLKRLLEREAVAPLATVPLFVY
jgi:HAD superfamily hydrolase (TIGR01459 family)